MCINYLSIFSVYAIYNKVIIMQDAPIIVLIDGTSLNIKYPIKIVGIIWK